MKAFLALSISLLVLCGCAEEQYELNEVAGNYVLSNEAGQDYLELKRDRTYLHIHISKEGRRHGHNGTWDIEADGAGPVVVLSDYYDFEYERDKKSSYTLRGIARCSGLICLSIGFDDPKYYKRISGNAQIP